MFIINYYWTLYTPQDSPLFSEGLSNIEVISRAAAGTGTGIRYLTGAGTAIGLSGVARLWFSLASILFWVVLVFGLAIVACPRTATLLFSLAWHGVMSSGLLL